jgi:hypothetical protein
MKTYLVKIPAPLLCNNGRSMYSFILKLDIIKLNLKPVLGLLSAGNLLVQAFNGLFSLIEACRQLLTAAVKLINSAKAISFKLGAPELYLSLGLGQTLESVRFPLRFFLNAIPQALKLKKEGR